MTATTVGGAVLRLRPSCAMLRAMYAISFDHAATTPVDPRVLEAQPPLVGAEDARYFLEVFSPDVEAVRRACPPVS